MRAPRPARVGMVVGQLTTGGAEGQLWHVARGVDPQRFTPIVYCLSPQVRPMGERLQAAGVPLHVTPHGGWRRVGWLRRRLAADGIDLVHSWLYIANAVTWAATIGAPARPLLTSARNCKMQGRLSRLANTLAFRASQGIVANSRDVAAYIERHYRAPAARIQVVYNGVDVERFRPLQPVPRTPAGPIVSIGRLVDQKNHALFLDAAARLVQTLPDARFIIVGDGPLRSRLEAQARDRSIADRVTFTGERLDVDELLRGAALFWLTSRWEGMPNVVLEALASGVPVVAADVGGVRELIRAGIDGFVVRPDDAHAFVEPSMALLTDATRWARCAAAARQRAEAFATPRMVDAMAAVYAHALGLGSC